MSSGWPMPLREAYVLARKLGSWTSLLFALCLLSSAGRVYAALSIRVAGNKLVDGNGATVQLHGVNRMSTEYACIDGTGYFNQPFDGPHDQASVQAIKSWGSVINAYRMPLNEDCWLDING